MAALRLFIGNKCFSTWSLRPWVAMKEAGIPFEETVIRLRAPDTAENLARISPTGQVPALMDGDLVVWESLAILEYLADLFPEKRLWPEDRAARALARAVSAEMHAGFGEIRRQWSMNLRRPRGHKPLAGNGPAQRERIEALWRKCRAGFGRGGPFLFGRFTLADAMYAPVATRFDTYGGELAPDTRAYVEAILALPAMREWYRGAAAETWPEPDPHEDD